MTVPFNVVNLDDLVKLGPMPPTPPMKPPTGEPPLRIVTENELIDAGVLIQDTTDDVLRAMFAAICEFNMGMEDCDDETVLLQMREALKAANAMGWVLVPQRYVP